MNQNVKKGVTMEQVCFSGESAGEHNKILYAKSREKIDKGVVMEYIILCRNMKFWW